MASPLVQMRVEGGGRGGAAHGGAGRRRIMHKRKGLRKSVSRYGDPSANASIPSRYQAFFHTSSEARGFNTQSTRFQEQLNVNDNPGPGWYSTPQSSLNTYPTSTSTAGRGGFASKTHRFRRSRRSDLGPGSYNPHIPPTRHDFSFSGVSSFFQNPIATKPDDGEIPRCLSPSPNTYRPSHTHTDHNHLVTAQAAFKSCSERTSIPLSASHAPSPGHYVIRDDLLHPTPSPHSSVFASKSQREGIPRPARGPGPADYTPHQSQSRANSAATASQPPAAPYYRQKHYLRISAPAMPLPPLPPSPGPGHYETQAPSQLLKKKASGRGFASNTDRWGSEVNSSQDDKPGPGTYDPVALLRKSYFYNVEGKWI